MTLWSAAPVKTSALSVFLRSVVSSVMSNLLLHVVDRFSSLYYVCGLFGSLRFC